MNFVPQSERISSGNPNFVNTSIKNFRSSAALWRLIGYASGKCDAVHKTVIMNLLPDLAQGLRGTTLSKATRQKILPITGELIRGALNLWSELSTR